MNVKSDFLESACRQFTNKIECFFDLKVTDVSLIRIDLEREKINGISSHYDWLLMNWDDDLDLLVSERISSGIQFWSNYSSAYANTFSRIKNNKMKVDICHKTGSVYEIISINTKKDIGVKDILNLFKMRPVLSDFTHKIWQQKDNIDLPLREKIVPSETTVVAADGQTSDLFNIHNHMRFGNIRLTQKEMLTIRMLLSQCRTKEISYIQGCSIMTEHQRIQTIKEKLGCPNASSSGLFKALNEHGITTACLDLFFTKQ